jgi:hypothetical protein
MAAKGLLRHSSANTTLIHYIKDVPEVTADGLPQIKPALLQLVLECQVLISPLIGNWLLFDSHIPIIPFIRNWDLCCGLIL